MNATARVLLLLAAAAPLGAGEAGRAPAALARRAAAHRGHAGDWRVATLRADGDVAGGGGLAVDGGVAYVCDKTHNAVWAIPLAGGPAELLAGVPDAPPTSRGAVRDGPRGVALLGRPRALCVLGRGAGAAGGDLLLLDATGGLGALLRVVSLQPGARGRVTTVLGNASAAGWRDGGAGAMLSAGSWLLACQPDGSAVLQDSQARLLRRVCPPSWPPGTCEGGTPPAPPPGPDASGGAGWAAWWQLALAALAGGAAVAGGRAAADGAAGWVAQRVQALRARHAPPPRQLQPPSSPGSAPGALLAAREALLAKAEDVATVGGAAAQPAGAGSAHGAGWRLRAADGCGGAPHSPEVEPAPPSSSGEAWSQRSAGYERLHSEGTSDGGAAAAAAGASAHAPAARHASHGPPPPSCSCAEGPGSPGSSSEGGLSGVASLLPRGAGRS
ncbi:hypothetical protein HT031_006680 [Scenedesmus sp. PABB004]|nr:hypothetical protein HT031_006680 [Scenedesmus sp. PABB004]